MGGWCAAVMSPKIGEAFFDEPAWPSYLSRIVPGRG